MSYTAAISTLILYNQNKKVKKIFKRIKLSRHYRTNINSINTILNEMSILNEFKIYRINEFQEDLLVAY